MMFRGKGDGASRQTDYGAPAPAPIARADRELRDAQHFFDPESAEEAEMDLVHAVAAARLTVTTALERVRFRLGEPEA